MFYSPDASEQSRNIIAEKIERTIWKIDIKNNILLTDTVLIICSQKIFDSSYPFSRNI